MGLCIFEGDKRGCEDIRGMSWQRISGKEKEQELYHMYAYKGITGV
jgi:hypothetical protein